MPNFEQFKQNNKNATSSNNEEKVESKEELTVSNGDLPQDFNLQHVWNEFIASQSIRIASFLKNLTPRIQGDAVWVTVSIKAQEEALEPIRPDFARFINKTTNGALVRLNVEVGSFEKAELKPYTDKEKLEFLIKKNPKVAEFVQKLEIRPK